MRTAIAVFLAALLAAPPVNLVSAPVSGTVQGVVTIAGRPVVGIALALIDLTSGAVHRTKSGAAGSFQIKVAPGDYVITSGGDTGLAIGRGPTRLSVAPGQVASADLDLVPLPVPVVTANASRQDPPPQEPPLTQEPPGPGETGAGLPPAPPSLITVGGLEGSATITHEAIGCFIAGEFPLIDANLDPPEKIARARIYFKAAQTDWFFVEMAAAAEGKFEGKLPRPKLEASPITYYIQATTTEFAETQTPEIPAIVVVDKDKCPGDRKVAAIGPSGPVQVFSAATGAAISPAGFLAGGAALTAGLIALILGAAAVGIGAVINNPPASPSPSPSPITGPSPEPSPSPSPEASPTPTPILSPPPVSPFR
jgi:hypothetical protein